MTTIQQTNAEALAAILNANLKPLDIPAGYSVEVRIDRETDGGATVYLIGSHDEGSDLEPIFYERPDLADHITQGVRQFDDGMTENDERGHVLDWVRWDFPAED